MSPTFPISQTYRVSLTRSPQRLDGARTSLLPQERSHSAAELRRDFPIVADALRDRRLTGPHWSVRGTQYEARFDTYREFVAAFPDMAEYIRMRGPASVNGSVGGIRLMVFAERDPAPA
jgi:hypothetical protein